MYIKLAGSLLVISGGMAMGILKAEELKERVEGLQNLRRLLVLLQGELRFHHTVLSEAFERVGRQMEHPYQEFLVETAERLDARDSIGFEGIWKETTEQLFQKGIFAEKDRQFWQLLGNSLCTLDLETQMDHMQLLMVQTEAELVQAKEEQRIKGSLYRTMGGVFGALLVLLII